MKKLIISVSFLFFSVALFAQPIFDLGLKGGINNSKLSFNSKEYSTESIVRSHIGAFARLGWGRIYVQPEVYFSSKGGEIFKKGTASERVARFDYNNIDVPVLLGVKVLKAGIANVRIMGGPVFSFVTKDKVDGEQFMSEDYYKDNYFGYQYGVGVDIWKIFVDARMEHAANKLYKHPELDLGGKNETFIVTLGLKIF